VHEAAQREAEIVVDPVLNRAIVPHQQIPLLPAMAVLKRRFGDMCGELVRHFFHVLVWDAIDGDDFPGDHIKALSTGYGMRAYQGVDNCLGVFLLVSERACRHFSFFTLRMFCGVTVGAFQA
jgi:hypothetical protein